MKTFTGKNWQNWSGSVSCMPNKIFFPTSEQDIIDAIQQVKYKKQAIRVEGSRHSFTPLIETEDNILSLKQYHGIYSIDEEKCEATVKSGTQLRALGQMLADRGLAMQNLGDIDCQTIAGAVSTGTHGTGLSLGGIATQVASFSLVTADGEVIHCSETENSEVFKAGQISLGALGIISKLTLKLMPAYYLKVVKKRCTLDESLENFTQNIENNRHFEFFWLPHTNYTYTKAMNITNDKKDRGTWRKYFSEIVFENGALFMFGSLCRLFPRWSQKISAAGTSLIPQGEETNLSANIFSSYRWVRFHEMEYSVPLEKGTEVLREIEAFIRKENIKVTFPIEFRVAKEDDIYLSPSYGRPSVYIAIHSFKGVPYEKYFAGCEAIFRKYNGRPHWGKMHNLKASDFKNIYPKWENFHRVRRELDPDGLFMNPYLQSIFEE
ncbi:D-arabinono-1,4-lactone oxidase [Candidatus Uabimicrobium amorphum]|uniref:FAD-binding oxidoreductase n=1 Tax=Uabimicrobium amorphum TaxID=2596890 RepID=A0A5S9IJV6_UABAM|nr:D-arabinono-1,4-lactone oxidase [Candidatus Uabimicrobium amorphum]BBM82721.1 FAD-binding oxidoreductase [Candidatus Uabimicrobium amorphum]